MDKLITKYWLPILVITLTIATFFEFSSVQKVDLGSSQAVQATTTPQKRRTLPAPAAPRTGSRLAVGERYASLSELVNDQQAAGFVRTGYFGKLWPATVSEIATDRNKISFVRQNGVRHNYTKFDGYDMKMVRLSAGANETIVVFRSLQKR